MLFLIVFGHLGEMTTTYAVAFRRKTCLQYIAQNNLTKTIQNIDDRHIHYWHLQIFTGVMYVSSYVCVCRSYVCILLCSQIV